MISMPYAYTKQTKRQQLSCYCETELLTLCGLTSQKTHQGGLGLGGSVHEEALPCFPYLIQTSFKGIDAGSIHHPLVQLIPSINHSV